MTKTSPQTSVMKVVQGKNQSRRPIPRGIKGTQVSGSNQYSPSENTSFLKKHIQYLGHIVSGEGIKPVPEKLSAIQQMPRPYTPK